LNQYETANLPLDPQLLLKNLHSGVVVHAHDTKVIYANPCALKLLRMSEEQALGRSALSADWNLIDESGKHLKPEEYPVNRVLATQQSISGQVIGIIDEVSPVPTWVLVSAYIDQGDIEQHVIVTFTDISDRLNINFSRIVDLANDIVIVTEAENLDFPGPRIVYVNKAFENLTGYPLVESIGSTPRILHGALTSRDTLDRVKAALKKGLPVREVILNYAKDGRSYWLDMNITPLRDHRGIVTHFVSIQRDVSATYTEAAELRDAASTDALTGLLNRRGFSSLVPNLIHQAQDAGRPYSVISLDVDLFKNVNDRFGHAEGDKLLVGLAKIMGVVFRKNDLCARFGGEEFVVFLSSADVNMAERIATRLLRMVSHELHTPDDVPVTISIGVSENRMNETLDALIERADQALYIAKRSGRNQVVCAP